MFRLTFTSTLDLIHPKARPLVLDSWRRSQVCVASRSLSHIVGPMQRSAVLADVCIAQDRTFGTKSHNPTPAQDYSTRDSFYGCRLHSLWNRRIVSRQVAFIARVAKYVDRDRKREWSQKEQTLHAPGRSDSADARCTLGLYAAYVCTRTG
jgi:hypothetical protein